MARDAERDALRCDLVPEARPLARLVAAALRPDHTPGKIRYVRPLSRRANRQVVWPST